MTDETPMSAVLRRAAARVREVSAHTTPGPWTWKTWRCPAVDGGPHHINCPGIDELTHEQPLGPQGFPVHPMNVIKVSHGDWPASAADQSWIATMSPVLAEPLATWLETAADYCDAGQYASTALVHDHPMAIARALLGEAT